MTAVVVVEGAAIALLAVLVFSLLRTQARVVAALREESPRTQPGPPTPPRARPGDPAPPIAGVDPCGRPAGWDPGQAAVLAFLTAGCTSCGWWWEQLRTSGARLVPGLVVVTPDPGTEDPGDLRQLSQGLRVVMSSDGWAAYGVRAGSTFVAVEGGRVRAAGSARSWDELAGLLSGEGR